MLTTAHYQAILARMSWFPGWKLDAYEDEFEGPHLFVQATEDDFRKGGKLDLGIRSAIPPHDTEAEFLRWLSWRTRRIIVHESMEALRIDGKPVYDPHAQEHD